MLEILTLLDHISLLMVTVLWITNPLIGGVIYYTGRTVVVANPKKWTLNQCFWPRKSFNFSECMNSANNFHFEIDSNWISVGIGKWWIGKLTDSKFLLNQAVPCSSSSILYKTVLLWVVPSPGWPFTTAFGSILSRNAHRMALPCAEHVNLLPI